MNTIILVVLYGRKNIKTSTTDSLLNLQVDYHSYTLLLFNNGPNVINIDNDEYYIKLKERFGAIFLINDILNRSLSDIYNSMIDSFSADKYIIFDDDSLFHNDYFNSDNDAGVDIQLPLIVSSTDDKIYYPRRDGDIINTEAIINEVNGGYKVYSIGSGMIIYSTLIDKFKKQSLSLFDPHFALYGVDFSLFRQIEKRISCNTNVRFRISGVIHHSMTGLEKKIPKWRHEERMYDYILSIKYYSKNKIVGRLKFIIFIASKFFSRDALNVYKYTKIFINGRHFRSAGTLDLFKTKGEP